MEVMPTSAVAWSHVMLERFLQQDHLVVDLTAGKGKDTLFAAKRAKDVLAMDIQPSAIEQTRVLLREQDIKNVRLICDNHEALENYVDIASVDAFVMNLGYLPGGDKDITTLWPSTKRTLDIILSSMKPGTLISLSIYPGHEAGKIESEGIEEMIAKLDQKKFKVNKITFPNQKHCPPYWVGIARC